MDNPETVDLTNLKGLRLSSWNQVEELKQKIEDQTSQVFTRRSTRPVKTYRGGIGKDKLKYGYAEFQCKFGGVHKTKSKNLRKARSYKVNCGAFIKLIVTEDGQSLSVKDCDFTHRNHDGTQKFSRFIPENRRLSNDEKIEALDLMAKGVKKTEIQAKFSGGKRNRFVSKKDLHNLAQKLSSPADDDLPTAINLLRNSYNARVSIYINDTNTFQGLYFSTAEMRDAMSLAPEIIFADCTYQLLRRKLALMLVLVEDQHGASRVVAAGLLANEKADTLRFFFHSFQQDNKEVCHKIRAVMTDKDMTERTVIQEIFPSARLYLCFFHTLQTFNREICPLKRNVSKAERQLSLSFLDQLARASSKEEYDYIYLKFNECAPLSVVEYFDIYWDPIKEAWAKYAMVDGNLGNCTNNRLESINGKIKREIAKNSTLVQFTKSFFKWFLLRNDELDSQAAQSVLRTTPNGNRRNIDEDQYALLLSRKGFELVQEELIKSRVLTIRNVDSDLQSCRIQLSDVTLNVTSLSCECSSFTTFLLPCRHIFAVRKLFNLPMFDKTLCAERWYNLLVTQ